MSEHSSASGNQDAETAWVELRAAGVIEQDAPSPFEHRRQMAALGNEFTADERRTIRCALGLYEASDG